MEVVGAATGVVRIALQVVSNQKRPCLEIYYHLINKFGPESEFSNPSGGPPIKTRNQEIGIEFYLVNIGGNRAEDVNLKFSGEFDRRNEFRSIKNIGIFNNTIPCVPPGQIVFLMKLDEFDLYDYVFTGGAGSPNGITCKTFAIELMYNGEDSGFNKIFRWFYGWRRRKQYVGTYHFIPKLFAGDLPSPDYGLRGKIHPPWFGR